MKHRDFIAYMAPQRGCDGSRAFSVWVPLSPKANPEHNAAQAASLRDKIGGLYVSGTLTPTDAWDTIEQAVDSAALVGVQV